MSFGVYLTGCVALAVAVCSCVTIGVVARRWLAPELRGAAAFVAAVPPALAGALVPALALGTFGLLTGWSWLALVVGTAGLLWRFRARLWRPGATETAEKGGSPPVAPPVSLPLAAIALAVAAASFGMFAAGTSLKLRTGMSVFDTNWYHGPLAVQMAETGNTLALHHVAPAFLTWFYPQDSELLHALGILIHGNDLVSPFVNLFWFAACLAAAWAIGRPYGAAPVSLAGVALVLGTFSVADQAGEGRNDLMGAFLVLAGVAILLNGASGGNRLRIGPGVLVALAAGLAAGTKVNFIPAAALLIGAALWLALPAERRRLAGWSIAAALVAGGYWYLRNLIQSGSPLPWFTHLGPLRLPGPIQDLGGREAGSVWGYLRDPGVIRDWFVPALREALGAGWLVVLLLVLAGIGLCLARGSDRARRAGAVVGLGLFAAWLFAPTSASGYPGEPNGFFTGLRYLFPALAVGMALLGAGVGTRGAGTRWLSAGLLLLLAPFTISHLIPSPLLRYGTIALLAGALFWGVGAWLVVRGRAVSGPRPDWRITRAGVAALALFGLAIVLIGQPIQRYYFAHRYTTAEYATPGLAAAFAWARNVDGERIGTTASRMYPFYGTKLGNQVGFIGVPRPHGGFVRPTSCRAFRAAVNRGGYRYLVTALDRLGPARSYPREATWVRGDPAAREILRREGAVVFELDGPLDPGACR